MCSLNPSFGSQENLQEESFWKPGKSPILWRKSRRQLASSPAALNKLTIQQMDQVTQQNAALAEDATTASQALSGQAVELQRLMDFFKLAAVADETAPEQTLTQDADLADRDAPLDLAEPEVKPGRFIHRTIQRIEPEYVQRRARGGQHRADQPQVMGY